MMRRKKAFTLIEMVIVLAIIALLILLIAPNLMQQKNMAEKKTDQAMVTTIQTQVELAKEDGKGNPTMADLQRRDFLSPAQVKHAKERGIEINDGVVKKK
ncbi:competence type IV pilus major pilin ComGC [Latilactobacillus fuchuensis]|jgi:competence protein ComGC|uniref:competence type IV pilus major pilin ComGC n=1 Tax=Latilactobacillus fuchuensis TaxID=164393 RepID=UPI000469B8DD|nr:competence type IV pilus major pilin ComGC [Latilactobacillus fuchuensis]MCP8858053.1 prepilin-type N-terminal cleavage/methylation domain-containing protein [Latilactobacillus fuchuensis]